MTPSGRLYVAPSLYLCFLPSFVIIFCLFLGNSGQALTQGGKFSAPPSQWLHNLGKKAFLEFGYFPHSTFLTTVFQLPSGTEYSALQAIVHPRQPRHFLRSTTIAHRGSPLFAASTSGIADTLTAAAATAAPPALIKFRRDIFFMICPPQK
jgi:hypothetical protein